MRKRCLAIVFMLLAPAAAGAATLGDAQVGFSADRTLVIDGHSYIGKIWAMPGKERHEQVIQGFEPVFLLRADSPLGEVVLAKMKTVVQFVMPSELRLLGSPELKKHPVGQDTVNGVATTKYAIDETVPEGHAKGTLWLSRDGIPMKLAGTFTGRKGKVAAVRWELSRVRIGPQPASLVRAAAGFSKLPPEAVAPLLGLNAQIGQALADCRHTDIEAAPRPPRSTSQKGTGPARQAGPSDRRSRTEIRGRRRN